MADKILDVKGLRTSFRIHDRFYAAVDNVSLSLHKNEILAIVGESGCGKSALAFSIMGLHRKAKVEGEILFQQHDLVQLSQTLFNTLRGQHLGMIFQDPLTALNPLMQIGDQISEVLLLHNKSTKKQTRKQKVITLLEEVGINHPERVYGQYPHELSGGMNQRVIVAIAIANNPSMLIADEPTTALDATIQSQILQLMNQLKTERQAGIMLITHDLGVVAEMADRVAVMYAGEIVEMTDVHSLFEHPLHPYTKSLLHSIPSNVAPKSSLHVIQGIVPSLKNLPRTGCRFKDRIPWLPESEHETNPQLREVKKGHFVRCTCYQHFDVHRRKEDK